MEKDNHSTTSHIHHQSIMVKEIMEYLDIRPSGIYVDATCGEGGHSFEMASRLKSGRLICIDRDPRILETARKRLADFNNIRFVEAPFHEIGEILEIEGISNVDGILADLGISMFHLKTTGLGFSYTDESSVDMKLEPEQKLSAYNVLNSFKEWEIADIIYNYGEETESRKIAKAIVRNRPIHNSKQLADIIRKVKRHQKGRIHPATRSFQALRIFVNDELKIIESFIPVAVDKLKAAGRIAIMSFHSLEDRIVKQTFRQLKIDKAGNILTKKPLTPTDEEKRQNPASRSAKLRVFEKGQI